MALVVPIFLQNLIKKYGTILACPKRSGSGLFRVFWVDYSNYSRKLERELESGVFTFASSIRGTT